MTEISCQNVRLSAMALHDGQTGPLTAAQIDAHLADCPQCRTEVFEMRELLGLLDGQNRMPPDEDLWSRIAPRIAAQPPDHGPLGMPLLLFAFVAAVLIACRLVGGISRPEFSFISRIIPLVLGVLLFLWMKINPFRINTGLDMKGI